MGEAAGELPVAEELGIRVENRRPITSCSSGGQRTTIPNLQVQKGKLCEIFEILFADACGGCCFGDGL